MNGNNVTDTNGHRDGILNAAIEVFGRVGYAAASTNEIVKLAKVSKGLLFHHFSNKENLYAACQIHVMEKYGEYMMEHINLDSKDFFERILYNLKMKLEFGRRHPEYLALINRTWRIDDSENTLDRKAMEDYVIKSTLAGRQLVNFFEGVDTGCFREGIDVPKLLNYTRLIMEASWWRFSSERGNDPELMLKDIDDYLVEAEEILALLKYGAYN